METKEKNKFLNKKRENETTFFKDEKGIDDEDLIASLPPEKENSQWINKTRILIVGSRGVSHQERHLINNLMSIIPNSKKECKIEKDIAKTELNEICFNHSCKYCLYFEHRKREFILYLFKVGEGPCAKFQIKNIHTLSEIKLMGNCIKYSRPILSFDKSFDSQPHLQLIKTLLLSTFNSPRGHPKTKPFYDHIISFCNVNDQIFVRNYQILNDLKEKFTNEDKEDGINLMEIGPRFTLNLIRIFDGVVGGKTLYLNNNYMSPGAILNEKINNFKKRKIKEIQEKIVLNDKLEHFSDPKRKWLQENI